MKLGRYKQVKSLNRAEAAYIAGIIDGEGTVTLTVKQKGGTRHLVVCVSNNELRMLDYLVTTIGAGKITRKRHSEVHHAPSYTYTLTNRQAFALLGQVTNYLHTYKRERAKLVLAEYLNVTPRNGRYNIETRELRQKFEEKFFCITT